MKSICQDFEQEQRAPQKSRGLTLLKFTKKRRASRAKNSAEENPASKIIDLKTAQPLPIPDVDPSKRVDATLATDGQRLPYDGNTAFKLYLREVGQTNLLTPAEELELAKRVKKGDKVARERMIRANLRLVVKIAQNYQDFGMPLLDLISEGNVGLIKAVERFDPSKGAKLSTYGAWWIKQSIKRALANQSKTIRLPIHVVDKLFRIRQASMNLWEILGREPTDFELQQEVGYSAKKIARLRTAALRPTSLESHVGDNEDSNQFAETLKDDSAKTPYEQLEQKTNASMIRELISKLPSREMEILKYRFGFDGDGEKTLDQVGQKLGVTRERIRQIQNEILKKLRDCVEKRETVRFAA